VLSVLGLADNPHQVPRGLDQAHRHIPMHEPVVCRVACVVCRVSCVVWRVSCVVSNTQRDTHATQGGHRALAAQSGVEDEASLQKAQARGG
jgi:hypothetical protein